MKPLQAANFLGVKAVFTDLDDTLTDDSMLHSETLLAMQRIQRLGLKLVIVSGRPAGWADCLTRLFPIDAMVFENGAGIMWKKGKKLETECLAGAEDLALQHKQLENLFYKLKENIPKIKLSSDQPYRRFDYAIDFGEEPPYLSEEDTQTILNRLNTEKNITAKLSSIHINYWVGSHTKITACQTLLARWGLAKETVVFSGDSPNDEPLFEFFPLSVGVANIKRFEKVLRTPPAFVTENPGGIGFREIVARLDATLKS